MLACMVICMVHAFTQDDLKGQKTKDQASLSAVPLHETWPLPSSVEQRSVEQRSHRIPVQNKQALNSKEPGLTFQHASTTQHSRWNTQSCGRITQIQSQLSEIFLSISLPLFSCHRHGCESLGVGGCAGLSNQKYGCTVIRAIFVYIMAKRITGLPAMCRTTWNATVRGDLFSIS